MQEFKNCDLDVRILKILSDWEQERKKDRKENKNKYTRNAIYRVESCNWEPCTEDEAERSLLCIPYEDDFTLEQIQGGALEEIYWDICDGAKTEIRNSENLDDVLEIIDQNTCETMAYIEHSKITYDHKALFFTHKEAEDYIKYQGHNLRNPRIYVSSTGYDNRGSLAEFLRILDTDDIFE